MAPKQIATFLKKFKSKHSRDAIEVTGILGFGSRFTNGKVSQNSDLDIYVVIKNIGKRFRGVMNIDGVEVDYFINPIEQLIADFEKVKSGKTAKRTALYMLNDGQIILDENNALAKLQAEAKVLLAKEAEGKGMPEPQITTAKYFIDDFLKDIADSLSDGDNFSWQFNVSLLLSYLVEIFCQYHKIPLSKPKQQGAKISAVNKDFVDLLNAIANGSSRVETTKRIRALSEFVLGSMGGRLPAEWELESKVSLD